MSLWLSLSVIMSVLFLSLSLHFCLYVFIIISFSLCLSVLLCLSFCPCFLCLSALLCLSFCPSVSVFLSFYPSSVFCLVSFHLPMWLCLSVLSVLLCLPFCPFIFTSLLIYHVVLLYVLHLFGSKTVLSFFGLVSVSLLLFVLLSDCLSYVLHFLMSPQVYPFCLSSYLSFIEGWNGVRQSGWGEKKVEKND